MLYKVIFLMGFVLLEMSPAKADVVFRTVPEAVMPYGLGEPPVDSDRFAKNTQLVLEVVKQVSREQVKNFKKMVFLYADVSNGVIEYHFSSENYVYRSVTCQLHLQFRVNTSDRDRIPYSIAARDFRCDNDF